MKNYKNKIKELRDKCDEFLQQVNSLGNECAWTDHKLENILDTADKIKNNYYNKNNNMEDKRVMKEERLKILLYNAIVIIEENCDVSTIKEELGISDEEYKEIMDYEEE